MADRRTSRRGFLARCFGALGAAALGGRAGHAAEPPPGWIAATTRIHGLPGRERELEAHLLSLAAPTRAEAGCVTYDLYRAPEAPHEFLRFEVWTSGAALEAHKQTPHIRASFEKRQREGWSTEIVVWQRVPG
jgi:quinol monooxygenase YgiN